ncbi:acyl-CoA dehydrogenase family protein [Archangium violaceum]|uniref:acyl-CoA dehydrogenase family protein n=1 Tax=Archangium violaceum TaxID=83451 RepID=UPI00194DDD9D|nr:acyl-CoA dehydrogenase family protein [Archangium violaceum]QRO00050.1 acyl-CoA dehydrogenase family protein [Archangium violaceum]
MSDVLLDSFLEDTHRQFYANCRKFAEAEIAPHAFQWDEEEGFPRELYEKAGAAGFLGVNFPPAYGGAGGDVFHVLLQIEALMWGGCTGVLASLNSLDIALPPILHLGTEAQKQRFIPPVLAGRKLIALAITEPHAGSDVAAIRTRAVRDGEHYVLNGSKTFITGGSRADLVCVLARTSNEPHRGLTFFVVEKGTRGFSISRALKKMGWRASDTATLSFEDCQVPVENRLGDEGSGFKATMLNFQMERLILAAYGHASAEVALTDAERYAQERSAFGGPLLASQVVRHKLAHMATLMRAAKCFNYVVADNVRRGGSVIEQVCEAKNFSSQVAQDVCYEAVQLFGGMGYMRETRVERLYRDVRVLPIGGGTSEIMNEIIAKTRGYGQVRQA